MTMLTSSEAQFAKALQQDHPPMLPDPEPGQPRASPKGSPREFSPPRSTMSERRQPLNPPSSLLVQDDGKLAKHHVQELRLSFDRMEQVFLTGAPLSANPGSPQDVSERDYSTSPPKYRTRKLSLPAIRSPIRQAHVQPFALWARKPADPGIAAAPSPLKAVSPIKVSRMHKPDAFFTDLKVNAHTVAEIVRGRVPAPLQHEKLKSRPDTIFREPHMRSSASLPDLNALREKAGERITLKGIQAASKLGDIEDTMWMAPKSTMPGKVERFRQDMEAPLPVGPTKKKQQGSPTRKRINKPPPEKLMAMLRNAIRQSPESLHKWLKKYDTDGSGELDYDEFSHALGSLAGGAGMAGAWMDIDPKDVQVCVACCLLPSLFALLLALAVTWSHYFVAICRSYLSASIATGRATSHSTSSSPQ